MLRDFNLLNIYSVKRIPLCENSAAFRLRGHLTCCRILLQWREELFTIEGGRLSLRPC